MKLLSKKSSHYVFVLITLIQSGSISDARNIDKIDRLDNSQDVQKEDGDLNSSESTTKNNADENKSNANTESNKFKIIDSVTLSDNIENLSKQILLKEIYLEKFNLRYRQNVAKQGRWKGIRYAASGECNGAFTLAGSIISIYNRGIHINRSSRVKTNDQEMANILPMAGSIVGASAAALEFGINEFHEMQSRKNGFSPGLAKKNIVAIKSEINELMQERNALVKLELNDPKMSAQGEIHVLEGKVLKDLLDQSLLEFQRFHLGARRLLAFQQMQYFFDFSRNVTNAIAYDFAYLSLHRRRRVWNYRAGVFFAVSGALGMSGPILSRLYAKSVNEYHRYGLKNSLKDIENKELSVLENDQKNLELLCSKNRCSSNIISGSMERCEAYSMRSKVFQDQLQSAGKQLAKAKLIATQNVGTGLYTGGSKLASGILFIIPGYYQLYNAKSGQTASRITNSLLLTSSIVGLPATAFSMADTLRIQLRGELDRHKLAKQGKLPNQLISDRLKQLDIIESKLKTQ